MQGAGTRLLIANNAMHGPKAPILSDLAAAPNGFGTIRLIAASMVILSHAFPLTGAAEPLELLTGGQAGMGTLAVAAFFLISGFLIPASMDRGTLKNYAIKRARRIIPALVVAVLVCAFILGPVMTQLPPGAYFTNPLTWRFIGNTAFLPVSYDLPGLFSGQPLQAVNGSLWSLKYEMACYLAVPILLAIKGLRKLAVISAWIGSFAVTIMLRDHANGVLYLINILASMFRFFGAGMVMYLFADRIPLRASWAWAALALTIGGAFAPLGFAEICATAGAYALITFACRCPPAFRRITAKGDISYGVYLYAFPIQQLLVPASLGFGGVAYSWLFNSLMALPLAVLAGLMSWLWVEKPALRGVKSRAAATIGAPGVPPADN